MHPGSGSEKKSWPVKHFVALVRKLVKARRHVRVLIGEAERDRIGKEDLDHFAAVAEVVKIFDSAFVAAAHAGLVAVHEAHVVAEVSGRGGVLRLVVLGPDFRVFALLCDFHVEERRFHRPAAAKAPPGSGYFGDEFDFDLGFGLELAVAGFEESLPAVSGPAP